MTGSELRHALACGRSGCPCNSGPNTHCPGPGHANGDTHPSLTVTDGAGINPLVHCHAGCDQSAVITALKDRGLWEAPPREPRPSRPSPRGRPVAIYQYRDMAGAVVAEKARFETRGPDGTQKTFLWRQVGAEDWRGLRGMRQSDLALYGAELLDEHPDAPVWLVEGEKAAHACRTQGLIAVCHAGGAAIREFGRALDPLRGRDVVIFPDNDPPGAEYAAGLARALRGIVRTLFLARPELPPKGDAVEWFAGGGSVAGLEASVHQLLPEPQVAPACESRAQREWTISTSPQSFVTEYIAYASLRTDAQPGAHELQAVVALSALAGPKPRLNIATEPGGWRLPLWGMHIVNTTDGRKSTVLRLMTDILAAAMGETALMEWEGSPQGIIQRLQERQGQATVFARDEFSPLIATMNKQGSYMSALLQVLIRAYDGGTLETIRTKKFNAEGNKVSDSDRVTDPYLVTLAASTYDSFMARATIDNILDGFLPRFVFYSSSVDDPRPLPMHTSEMDQRRNALVMRAHRLFQRCGVIGEVRLNPEVQELKWTTERDWRARAKASSRPSTYGPVYQRLGNSLLRVAALLALDETESLDVTVQPEHYAAALLMGERWRICVERVIEDLGATPFLRSADLVLDTIRRSPGGVSRSDVLRAHRGIRGRDMAEILQSLIDQERISEVKVPTSGRPTVMLVPVPQ